MANSTVNISALDLIKWREEWLESNDPHDGTDVVTPFDKYMYKYAPANPIGLYDYNTPLLWEDGVYLVRVTEPRKGKPHTELHVALYVDCGAWYPTGVEFDPWERDWHKEGLTIEVITRFDLEAIEKSARAQL